MGNVDLEGPKRTFCCAGDSLVPSVIIRVVIKRGLYICKDPLNCVFQICTHYNMLHFNFKMDHFSISVTSFFFLSFLSTRGQKKAIIRACLLDHDFAGLACFR